MLPPLSPRSAGLDPNEKDAEVDLPRASGAEGVDLCSVTSLASALGVSLDKLAAGSGERRGKVETKGPATKARAEGIGFENSRVDNPPKKPRHRKRKGK